jgi:hypothetical protein
MEARLAPATIRQLRLVLTLAAVVGALIGAYDLVLHATTDPLADVHAYYDAGARLNAGQPLYDLTIDSNSAAFYRYPPLLAIAFRPLAMLPFPVAAVVWEGLLLVAFAFSVWRLGLRLPTVLALGILAMPIVWSLTIGQAQVLVTALLVVASPWAVALAGHLKLMPFLVAVFWLGRRDWKSLGRFAAWAAGLAILQLVLEPRGTIAYLTFPSLTQQGLVNDLSIFALAPVVWVGLVIVGLGVALCVAPTRWGWAAAVALSVFAAPRLLAYQLSTLLAALGTDSSSEGRTAEASRDAATISTASHSAATR